MILAAFSAAKGNVAREQLIKRGAQAVDVTGRPQLLERATGLLGTHVGRCANRGAGLRLAPDTRPRLEIGSLAASAVHRHDIGLADALGQSPVNDECFTILDPA